MKKNCNLIFAKKTPPYCICKIKNRKKQDCLEPFVDDPCRNSRLQEGKNTYKSVIGEKEFLRQARGTFTITVT